MKLFRKTIKLNLDNEIIRMIIIDYMYTYGIDFIFTENNNIKMYLKLNKLYHHHCIYMLVKLLEDEHIFPEVEFIPYDKWWMKLKYSLSKLKDTFEEFLIDNYILYDKELYTRKNEMILTIRKGTLDDFLEVYKNKLENCKNCKEYDICKRYKD